MYLQPVWCSGNLWAELRWALRAKRPYVPEELLTAQVVPVLEKMWMASGYDEAPIDFSNVSYVAMRRMAGNTFNQACASSLAAFCLSQLQRV